MVAPHTRTILHFATHPRHSDPLMIERGIGYWITPEGDFVPTPPRISHADVMRELIQPDTLDADAHDAFRQDPNAYAINQGWSRVRIYPGQSVAYIDCGKDHQADHLNLVTELIDNLGLTDIALKYTDADGNYISP
ncbi:MAG: hypothetical protein AAF750_16560 [Planctomycetota bacterium]